MDKLFTTDKVHTINIELSDEDWADLKENPKSKTKYEANITIDGETLENVSFATKGNTSLSSVADDEDSDRYSFKVNFGKFTDGQTYYGLDKLYLNNIYADATYMKDYLSYRIFSEAGIESPLVSYVSLTVNGENAGLYIAIEEIGESYLARTANGEGELYKPETEQLDNINGGDMKLPDNMQQPPEGFDGSEAPESPSGQQGYNSDSTSSEDDRRGMTPPNGGDMPESRTVSNLTAICHKCLTVSSLTAKCLKCRTEPNLHRAADSAALTTEHRLNTPMMTRKAIPISSTMQ